MTPTTTPPTADHVEALADLLHKIVAIARENFPPGYSGGNDIPTDSPGDYGIDEALERVLPPHRSVYESRMLSAWLDATYNLITTAGSADFAPSARVVLEAIEVAEERALLGAAVDPRDAHERVRFALALTSDREFYPERMAEILRAIDDDTSLFAPRPRAVEAQP